MTSNSANTAGWPFTSDRYAPYHDDGHELHRVLDTWCARQLSETTMVSTISPGDEVTHIKEVTRNLEELLKNLYAPQDDHRIYFVHKHLVRDKKAEPPGDANKLRISKRAFYAIAEHLDLPASFVSAMAQLHLPCGAGFRSRSTIAPQSPISFWYILPVRIQFQCNDRKQAHALSSARNDQMNPHHFLHLPDSCLDVRGSHIAVFSRFVGSPASSVTLAVSFMDGRWTRSVEEPQRRLREAMTRLPPASLWQDPFFVHSIFLTSCLRWWMNALSSVNDQLIAYERRLQEELDAKQHSSDTFSTVNRALHSIAGHLHRYTSELTSIQETVTNLRRQQRTFCTGSKRDGNSNEQTVEPVSFDQIAIHLKQIRTFLRELEVKLQNILALLFNRIQLTNDRLVVRNGQQMSSILHAIQEDAQTSQQISDGQAKLAASMKEDSVAMKSIAVTTMFFLPGTSFAAFLAMPFFNDNTFLTNPAKIWIWVVCSIPSTLAAFAFYFYTKKSSNPNF